MKTVYDVKQLLKRFGIFIYFGDRLLDMEMIEMELKELYRSNCIERDEYSTARMIIRQESNYIQNKRGEN